MTHGYISLRGSSIGPSGPGPLLDGVGRPHIVDNTKVKTELGIEFRDLNETIRETWQDLDRLGFLGRRVKTGATADL